MRWLSRLKRVLLVTVGMGIGLNGVIVAVVPGRIPATYGIAVDGPDVAVLLRHRAILLVLLGAAAAIPDRRELALRLAKQA